MYYSYRGAAMLKCYSHNGKFLYSPAEFILGEITTYFIQLSFLNPEAAMKFFLLDAKNTRTFKSITFAANGLTTQGASA